MHSRSSGAGRSASSAADDRVRRPAGSVAAGAAGAARQRPSGGAWSGVERLAGQPCVVAVVAGVGAGAVRGCGTGADSSAVFMSAAS